MSINYIIKTGWRYVIAVIKGTSLLGWIPSFKQLKKEVECPIRLAVHKASGGISPDETGKVFRTLKHRFFLENISDRNLEGVRLIVDCDRDLNKNGTHPFACRIPNDGEPFLPGKHNRVERSIDTGPVFVETFDPEDVRTLNIVVRDPNETLINENLDSSFAIPENNPEILFDSQDPKGK